MSNINDHRIDITGEDWCGAFRADGDYIAWRYVEPILEVNKTLLEALESFVRWHDFEYDHPDSLDDWQDAMGEQMPKLRAAIAKAKGEQP